MPGKNDGDPELTIESVVSDAGTKMDRTLDALRRELNNLRTGKATPSMVENLLVDYYGTPTPLKQLATISAPDPRAILIQPWDKQALRDIERGLIKAEGGFNPSNDGNIITVPIPPLTQERRQEMVKSLKRKIEDGKVSVRSVRRDAVDTLRKMEKDKAISQDEQRRVQDIIQKTTDAHTKTIEDIGSTKEAEILQV
ncbi:MAG: ribosome recycling factor [Chloroflexi bacterium]|nr:ribosome recycling factor [Chloroflexota bacterium]MDA1218106.1 ribosome recycling factor [Chloroflexota bacterium]PKB57896.1 MAG: ribosome recycling factor [SAR202 cluster bacterium Casp-Chloro-G3]